MSHARDPDCWRSTRFVFFFLSSSLLQRRTRVSTRSSSLRVVFPIYFIPENVGRYGCPFFLFSLRCFYTGCLKVYGQPVLNFTAMQCSIKKILARWSTASLHEGSSRFFILYCLLLTFRKCSKVYTVGREYATRIKIELFWMVPVISVTKRTVGNLYYLFREKTNYFSINPTSTVLDIVKICQDVFLPPCA